MLIYTCPKCDTDLDETIITTYPPIYKKTCPKCGWSVEIREPIIKQTYVDPDNIVIMGYSIWTWIATYCASNNKVNWLILIAPYDNAINLYNSVLNIFYGPMKLLAKYRFDSLSYAKNVDSEVQIITSYDDEIINYKLSQNLLEGFKRHKDIVILDNWVNHNNYFHQGKVLDTIKEYLIERLK